MLFTQGVVRWLDVAGTEYLRHVPASVVVSQSGVDDFLLSQSALPSGSVSELGGLAGVASATPVLALAGVLTSGSKPLPVFVVGFPPGSAAGPWRLSSGRQPRGGDEVVLDRGLAQTNGIGVGASVALLGRSLRVVGLSEGTNAAGIFFVFVPLATAQAMAGAPVIGDVFLSVRPGVPQAEVMQEVDAVGGVHALSVAELAGNDDRMIRAGFSQPVEVLVWICLLVGLLIASMVLYTTTVEHARDFALLKAVGIGPAQLAAVAVLQSLVLSVGGFALGWVLSMGLIAVIHAFEPVIDSYLSLSVVTSVLGLLVVIDLLALILPLAFLRRVDPQEVFKA